MTLRWKERTRRTPRQILLPRVQTTAVTPATLSLLWESTGETIRYWLSMPSPRRDRCKVPVSWGSVGPLQVLVYLAKVVTPVPVYLARVVTVAKALKLPEATHRGATPAPEWKPLADSPIALEAPSRRVTTVTQCAWRRRNLGRLLTVNH